MRAEELTPEIQQNDNHRHQHPLQAASPKIQLGQSDHQQQQSLEQPQGSTPTEMDTVERQLQVILGASDEPFLSVDAEVHSRSSDDGSSMQPLQSQEPLDTSKETKRKMEVAFPDSPVDKPEAKRAAVLAESDCSDHPQNSPLSTSSPRQRNTKENISDNSCLLVDLAKSVPSGSGPGLRAPGSDVEAPRGRQLEHLDELERDGQHQDADNCGCHHCIKELAITKLEPLTPGKELSAGFRACVKRLKIYRCTALKSHPSGCLCRTHLEKLKYRPAKQQKRSKGWPRSNTPPKLKDPSEFTSKGIEPLKVKKESGKVDPRTGLPPPIKPVTEDENSQRQNIAVITSR